MKYIAYFFWFLIIVIGITFASLNSHTVTFNYYIGISTIHLPVLLLIALILGVLLGVIAMLSVVIRAKHASRQLKQRIKDTEQEVNNLRNIPIKGGH